MAEEKGAPTSETLRAVATIPPKFKGSEEEQRIIGLLETVAGMVQLLHANAAADEAAAAAAEEAARAQHSQGPTIVELADGDEDMEESDEEAGDMSSLKAEMEAHAQRTGKAEISHDDIMGLFTVVSRKRVKVQGKPKSSRGTPKNGPGGKKDSPTPSG